MAIDLKNISDGLVPASNQCSVTNEVLPAPVIDRKARNVANAFQIRTATEHVPLTPRHGTKFTWLTLALSCFALCQNANAAVLTNSINRPFLSSGAEHALMLKTDGTVWVWGNN